MITSPRERRQLLNAVCTLFRCIDTASSPADLAVVRAKRAILNGLFELHVFNALDDGPLIAALAATTVASQGHGSKRP